MIPPFVTAALNAANVHDAAVPVPTTLVGWEVSTSWVSGGTVIAVHDPVGLPGAGNVPESPPVAIGASALPLAESATGALVSAVVGAESGIAVAESAGDVLESGTAGLESVGAAPESAEPEPESAALVEEESLPSVASAAGGTDASVLASVTPVDEESGAAPSRPPAGVTPVSRPASATGAIVGCAELQTTPTPSRPRTIARAGMARS
jgi:hypothetical protein